MVERIISKQKPSQAFKVFCHEKYQVPNNSITLLTAGVEFIELRKVCLLD
jgi:hypothetical protein